LSRAARPQLDEFTSQALGNTAWAFATAGVTSPDLFEALAAEALERLDDLNPQNLANAAWAFACAGSVSRPRLAATRDRVLAVMDTFDGIQLSQLYQFWVYLRLERLCRGPPTPFEDKLRRAYGTVPSRPSHLQRDVADALSQLGWTHDFEFVTDEGFSLDIARPAAKCCVEVDGPFHYLTDTDHNRLVHSGATRLKTRLLQGLGWTVARVPFYEWNLLESDDSRRRYLRAKLQQAAAAL